MLHTIGLQFIALLVCSCAATPAGPDQLTSQTSQTIAGHRIYKMVSGNCNSDLRYAYSIYQNPSGMYWLGGQFGLRSYNEQLNQCVTVPLDEGFVPKFISQSKDGKLWVVGSSIFGPNLIILDQTNKKSDNLSRAAAASIGLFSVTALFNGSDNRLWFASGRQLFPYREGTLQPPLDVEAPRSKGLDRITFGLQDKNANLWVGIGTTICRYDPRERKWSTFNGPSSDAAVIRAYEDHIGRVWFAAADGVIGTYDEGVKTWMRYDLREKVKSMHDNANRRVASTTLLVYGICEDNEGQVLLATQSGLFYFSDREGWQFVTISDSALPDNIMTAITKDREGRIWIGTARGVLVLDS